MFLVTSAHPLHLTRLVAVWVVRYSVVIGLRLQGTKVLRVVVQVDVGVGFALSIIGVSLRVNPLSRDAYATTLNPNAAATIVEMYMVWK